MLHRGFAPETLRCGGHAGVRSGSAVAVGAEPGSVGVGVIKKLLVVAAVVGAATLVFKKVKASSDERALWHEATTAPDLR